MYLSLDKFYTHTNNEKTSKIARDTSCSMLNVYLFNNIYDALSEVPHSKFFDFFELAINSFS